MDEFPEFLPPVIDLSGSYKEIIERLYSVFLRDFIETRAHHLSRNVTFNGVINEHSQGKVEGFWHIITREDSTKINRLIDFEQARRLPWTKPLIENPYNKEITFFSYDEGTLRQGIRHYIWFKKGRYVVVLKKRKYDYYWITAFYVETWKEKDLQKRFEKRLP